MDDSSDYIPPKVWTWNKPSGGQFANINRPIAGPTHEKELPVGRHPLQLYSLATPNGVKVTVMLEELLALGHAGAEYDAWLIRIGEGDQFGSGFVAINPNSKIPALMDRSGPKPIRRLRVRRDPAVSRREVRGLPADRGRRARRMPVLAVLADGKRALSRRRFRPLLCLRAEQDRICDRSVRDGGEASPRRARSPPRRDRVSRGGRVHDCRYRRLAVVWRAGKGRAYGAAEFLNVQEYKNVLRWTEAIAARPAVKRGRMVNRTNGDPSGQLHERHDASDFETRTQDKLAAASEQPSSSGSRRRRLPPDRNPRSRLAARRSFRFTKPDAALQADPRI